MPGPCGRIGDGTCVRTLRRPRREDPAACGRSALRGSKFRRASTAAAEIRGGTGIRACVHLGRHPERTDLWVRRWPWRSLCNEEIGKLGRLGRLRRFGEHEDLAGRASQAAARRPCTRVVCRTIGPHPAWTPLPRAEMQGEARFLRPFPRRARLPASARPSRGSTAWGERDPTPPPGIRIRARRAASPRSPSARRPSPAERG